MRALRFSQALIRFFSTAQRNTFENRVRENQKLFQENNDVPVYLKGGRNDNILYLVTMTLTMGGLPVADSSLLLDREEELL
ncbi:cytochrome c oxidase subunit 7A1, mitochondrial isoform 1-T2 [Thomomys bottae]